MQATLGIERAVIVQATLGKLTEKHTYCKAKIPFIRKKAEMTATDSWPAA